MKKLRIRLINKLKEARWAFKAWLPSKFVYLFAALYDIELGKKCKFWSWITFYKVPGSRIVIGDRCDFRSDKNSNLIGINHPCILSAHAPGAILQIGNDCGFSGSSIGAKDSVIIGNKVLIGANSIITDCDWHSLNPNNRFEVSTIKSRKVVIEDNVWVGANCFILKGTHIGKNTVVGAGSIVSGKLPENAICGGNPCKVLKYINPDQ